MTLNFKLANHLWEYLAGAVIAQQSPGYPYIGAKDDGEYLLEVCGLRSPVYDRNDGQETTLRFDLAYDPKLMSQETSYIEGLARMSGISFPMSMPLLMRPDVPGSEENYIVFAHGVMHKESTLPPTVLRTILRLLKTYCEKIYYIGNANERPDLALMESEMLCHVPIQQKVDILSGAKLVVGTPNEWTWLATAWRKKIAVMYPATQSMRRWYPFAHDNFGRVLFTHDRLDPARLVAELRALIAVL